MSIRALRMAAGWIAAAILISVPVYAASPAVCAVSAILMDAESGRVLYEKSCDTRSLVASTTKIMTAILIVEDCGHTAQVAVPKEAVMVEGSAAGLREGQVLSVEELLYGLMLHSGSVEAFVEKMNDKAQELELHGTHFENPHGLDSAEHYSTARDLAVLTAYAMNNPDFLNLVSTKTICFEDRTYRNHNKLLWMYPGCIGIKTGYTKKAGRILVSAAERNGRRLIAVTICDRNDWQDHIAMLDYGYSRYETRTLASSGQIMGEVPVLLGTENAVAVLRERIQLPVSSEETVRLRVQLPPLVFAPVMAGDRAGCVIVELDGVPFKEYSLYWRNCVFEEM